MIFVMSGLDGSLDAYNRLIRKHGITENDTIYVLGGVVGRDLELACELSMNPNVYAVMSEVDYTALRMLGKFYKLTKEGGTPDADYISDMQKWVADGGDATLAAFRELDDDMKEGIVDYLGEFALFEEAESAGTEYLLVSGGISGSGDIYDLGPKDFLSGPLDMKRRYAGRKIVITARSDSDKDKPVFVGNNVSIGVGRPYCVRLGSEVECL